MKRIDSIIALLLLTSVCAVAQGIIPAGKAFAVQLQQRDSILVADQIEYGVEISDSPAGAEYSFPDFSQGVMDNVVLVRDWRADTLMTRAEMKARAKGDTIPVRIRASVVLAPFEEGIYEIPVAVRRVVGEVEDTLFFDPQLLDVKTMPVDTATFVPHDIKGQIRYPLTFRELLPYLGAFYLLAVLVILAVCLVIMRRKVDSSEAAKEPPYITALRGLDKYRGDKFWAPDKQKIMYSGITDTLRTYIESRFDVNAEEMTTAEIFEELKKSQDITPDLYAEIKELFELSDFVKFAKHTASDEENAKAIPSAVRFVTSTYQVILEQEAEKNGEEAAGE